MPFCWISPHISPVRAPKRSFGRRGGASLVCDKACEARAFHECGVDWSMVSLTRQCLTNGF